MRVNSVSGYNGVVNNRAQNNKQSFGNAFVTLSKANLGDVIARNVDAYNIGDFAKMYKYTKNLTQKVINEVNATLSNSEARIRNAEDLVNKVDLFALAAGSGSRFKVLADAVSSLRGKSEKFNKISVPFELGGKEQPLIMLDVPMSMGRFFASKEGYGKIIADKPTGSFGDVIQHYLHTGRPAKDVVICCGDNVFDLKGEEMLKFIVRTINNPKKQMGVVGVARTPEEVAKRFGVLKVGAKQADTGLYSLEGFVEKPSLEQAQKLVNDEGVDVANTGMFLIKKETMEKLLKIIGYEQEVLGGKTTYIAKDGKEIYDFANAEKWAQFINGSEAADVKIVKTWEDVGEPSAYKSWLQQIKNGHYLENFTPERKKAVMDAVSKRVTGDSIQFSINPKGTQVVDGINISA